jgi:hypothetical protein
MTSYVPGPETEQDKIRECEVTRDLAEKDEKYTLRCIYGEKVFYVEDTKARMPGHCYSEEGVREVQRISGCCEYHFDVMFAPEDDEDNA